MRWTKYAVVAVLAILFALAISPRITRRPGDIKAPADRKPMPEFAMTDMSGQEWRLSARKGRVILVNFWATWCPPCRAETPALVSVANELGPRGFEIAGVTMDEDPDDAVPGFVRRYNVPYPILVPGADSALASAIPSLPTSFLIDRHGRVARTYVGAIEDGELSRDVEKLLAER